MAAKRNFSNLAKNDRYTSLAEMYAGMAAVIYARYSSHNQRDVSIEQQVDLCKEWARRHGVKVTKVYHDHAKTGRNDKRPDFQKMIRDSEGAQWQLVITYDTTRFARSRYDSAVYKRTLAENGIRVVYTTVTIDDSPEGILLEANLEGYAEYQSAKLSVDISRGLYDNARAGLVNGSLPFGYRKSAEQKYELHPTHSAVVREVFELYDEGNSTKEICDMINNRGILTKRKTKWNKNSLRHMLQNERYTGTYIYGDVRLEGAIPPIVSKELFDSVQKKVKKMKQNPAAGRSEIDYLLTGKLFCGLCGTPMTGVSGKGKQGTKYTYYACHEQRRHQCIKKPVRKEWIEEWVVRQTVQVVLQDEVINKLADAAIEVQERELDTSILDSLKNQLRDVNKRLDSILDALERGIITDSTKERLESLEAQKNDLKLSLEEAEDAILSQPRLTKKQLVDWMKAFKDGDVTDEGYRNSIIETFVHSVYLYDDHGRIVYNYSGEDNTIEFQMVKECEKGDAIPFPTGSTIAQDTPPKPDNPNLVPGGDGFGLSYL